MVTEWVGLIGGMEQGVTLPSLSWLVGGRTPDGAEFGIGPNITAREDFEEASRELTEGAQAQDAQAVGGRFGAVGLHLLLGLVRNAQEDRVGAERALAREITFESAGHIYSAQACASAWYAAGAMHLAAGDVETAMAAFVQSLERAPGHPMALAAMAGVVRGSSRAAWLERLHQCTTRLELRGAVVDAAVAKSVADVLEDRPARAADRILVALARESESSSSGWGIPADPLLQTWRDRNVWQGVLATLRGRAA